MLARVVAEPKGDLIPVRVINSSPHPVVLYQNTTLGSFTELEREALLTRGISRVQSTQRSTSKKQKSTQVAEMLNLGGGDLSTAENTRLAELLDEFSGVFAKDGADLGRTKKVRHRIPTRDAVPVKQRPRPLNKMLDQGVIEPSTSPWASPIVLVKKKDGSTRFCVDYRKLNDLTRKDAYPLPRIDETLDALTGAKYFSTLALASGYWQVELDPQDREKSAFTTPVACMSST